MITTLAALLALVAFVIGASFVGAEWNSGGMMNLLLWRPQRLQVLGTKLAALLVGLTALTRGAPRGLDRRLRADRQPARHAPTR